VHTSETSFVDAGHWPDLYRDFGTVDGFFAWLAINGGMFSREEAEAALTLLAVILAATGPVWKSHHVYFHACDKSHGVASWPCPDPGDWPLAQETAYPVEAVRAFLSRYFGWGILQTALTRTN
jgi:hypothetical protein